MSDIQSENIINGVEQSLLPMNLNERDLELLHGILETIPDAAMALDRDRRILIANRRLLGIFNITAEYVKDKRPGDAIGCIFAHESPKGCGSGTHCRVCGALQSIIASRKSSGQSVNECQLILGGDNETPLDLEITSSFCMVGEEPLTITVLRDVSNEKRRNVLERLFFHDVINTIGGIHGLAQLLNSDIELTSEQDKEYRKWMLELSQQLSEEITHHRSLLFAEEGKFTPELELIITDELIKDIQTLYSKHEVCEGRTISIGPLCSCEIINDKNILRRILGNLLKNALEATSAGGIVTVSCNDEGDKVSFNIHNDGVIPEEVQLQLFRRSFSTKKGTGRGLGTYSAKLFGERYLKGEVYFTSREPEGTTFTLRLPKRF